MASILNEAEVDILNNMKDFVFGFNKKLADIREVLSETISEAWNSDNDLLQTSLEPTDTVHITNCVQSDNVPLKKIVTVFSVLMAEMRDLKSIAETKFYGPLSMFGHQIDVQEESDADPRDKKIFRSYRNRKVLPMEQQMGEFLPVLQDLSNFTKRVNAVVRNVVSQCACLFHDRMKLYQTTFKNVEFDYLFESLGSLLTVLVTIDTIISDNVELQDGWVAYKRMLKYIRSDPERYNVNEEQLSIMEQLMMQIDERVMSNSTFSTMLLQDMNITDGNANVISGNLTFAQVFADVITRLIFRLRAGLNEPLETYERTKFIDVYSLYAVFRSLYTSTIKVDMKLFKVFWELQTKVPIVCVYGRACWYPADFLIKYTPTDNSGLKPAPKNVLQVRKDILRDLDESFISIVEKFHNNVCIWIVRMEGELLASQEHNTGSLLNARAKLLIHGVLLANQIKTCISTLIFLRLGLNVSYLSKNIKPLNTCIDLLKTIEYTFKRRLNMISENLQHMIAQCVYAIKKIVKPIHDKLEKRDLMTDRKFNDTKSDIYSALNMVLHTLEHTPTSNRRIVLSLVLSIAQLKMLIKSEFEEEMRFQIWKLERLCRLQQYVGNNTNCSFIYWIGNMVPLLMSDVVESQIEQCNRLQYIFLALRDSSTMLRTTNYNKDQGKQLQQVYQAECRAILNALVVTPIAREIETDLRLYIHSIVLNNANLYKATARDLSAIINMKPLYVFNEIINIKHRIIAFLNESFYNLNTVALHDGHVYSKMRNLAQTRYNLTLIQPHLPLSAHYSESLDVLEIMRNIHVFVARYNYNLNAQIFIERAVDQKHINIIDVEHMASSIATHGSGIMNTTVNFTYQFLCRKLALISEFLFDDHIKSPLLREIRYFKQHKTELKNIYPYAHAEQFVKDVRKLGISQGGLTYLDQLRTQITEVGNALGYVRMIRSGGLREASLITQYIPDLQDVRLFCPSVKQAQLNEECVIAADVADRLIENITQRLSEGSDYFYVLVQIFGDLFTTEEHIHIRTFHTILPALTISFVDAMLAKKEKLHKRSGKAEASFTDDGFALGVAYLLKLLRQDVEFDALHWFDSVSIHLRTQKAKLQEIAKSKSSKTLDAEHAVLNLQKIEALTAEFELLHFAIEGARVFFRDTTSNDAHGGNNSADGSGADGASSSSSSSGTPSATSATSIPSASSSSSTSSSSSGVPEPALTDVPQAPDLGFFM